MKYVKSECQIRVLSRIQYYGGGGRGEQGEAMVDDVTVGGGCGRGMCPSHVKREN